jgi:hypothetical protein
MTDLRFASIFKILRMIPCAVRTLSDTLCNAYPHLLLHKESKIATFPRRPRVNGLKIESSEKLQVG